MFSEAPESEEQQGELIDALQEWKSAKYQEIIGMPLVRSKVQILQVVLGRSGMTLICLTFES